MQLQKRAFGLAASLLAAVTAFAAPAALSQPPSAERVRGGMFDASDPAGIARFMERTGYRVELRSDAKGDPVIAGRISRSDYLMQFYECENGSFCNSVQLIVQVPRPATLTGDSANAFNAKWRYVRVTYDQSQAKLQMDVNLDAGVTADNLEDTLDIWRQLVEIFEREILGAR
ncbi:MAG: YbjN domain-containing protein [Hyphomonadaceae bacterium]